MDEVTRSEEERPCLLFGEIGAWGSFCEVLAFLGRTRGRGELVVVSGDVERSLYLDEGYVVEASSTAPKESIGEILCRAEIITRAQLDEATSAMEAHGVDISAALAAKGILDEESLFREMGRRIDAVFEGVARAASGTFYFYKDFDESRLAFRQRRAISALLRDVIRRIDETDYFRTRMPTPDFVPMRADDRSAPKDAPAIWGAIDGKATLGDIQKAQGELAASRAIFELVQTGHVTFRPPPLDAKRIANVYNDAITFLLEELEGAESGAGVRKKLTKFAKYSPTRDLLVEAGPRDDGTFDIDAIAHNVEATGNAAAATERLSTWLYDYASYALFLAQPHLAKRDAEASARVSERLLAILEPITPAEKRSREAVTKPPTKGGTLPPPAKGATSRLPRVRIPGVDPSRTVKIAPFDEKKIAEALAARANPKLPAPPTPSPMPARGRFAGLAAAVLVVFAVASLGYVCGSRSAARGASASHP